jgi:hypothetical protein
MRVTERMRRLRFVAPIDFRVENRAAMRGYIHRALLEGGIERTRKRYVSVGLVPADLDIAGTVEDLLERELVGYYDAGQKRLVLRDDLADVLSDSHPKAQARIVQETLVHELVHALQDQNLELSLRLHDKRTTDQENAYAALVEGDAQLVTLGYSLAQSDSKDDPILGALPGVERLAIDGQQKGLSPELLAAPPFVRIPLLFRYRNGAAYVGELYRRGGFETIDRAHRDPPTTTAAILNGHWPDGKRETEHSPLTHPCVEASGFRAVDSDSLGALEVAIAANVAPKEVARVLLEDQYTVYENGPHIAAIWTLRASNAKWASRLSAGLERSVGTPHQGVRLLLTKDAEVLVVRGLNGDCAENLAAAWRRSP